MARILHLSDLHFGDEHFFNQSGNDRTRFTIGEAITDALSRAEISDLDTLLITGDLFSKEQPKDKVFAEDRMKELLAHLKMDAGKVQIVPGNRDLSWDAQFKKEPFRFYDGLLSTLAPRAMKHDQLPAVVRIEGQKGPDVDLILLDSCQLEGRDMEGFGRVGETQLKALRELPQLYQKGSGTALRIAALHHHLLPVWGVSMIWDPENPKGKPLGQVSHTLDALNVLKQLASNDVSIVLHGHQHKPFITRYENHLGKIYSIAVVGAGSAGSKPRDEAVKRQFFVHDIEPDTLHCRSFMQSDDNPSMFELDRDSSATVPLVSPVGADHACLVDRRVTRIRRAAQPAKNGNEGELRDSSDLFYLFLSVVNCVEARRTIRGLESSWWKERRGAKEAGPGLVVTEMYDLMGRWDLLVRFRTAHSADARDFAKEVLVRLQGGHEQQENYNRKHFASREFIDVMEEHAVLVPDREPARPEIFRTLLGGTEDYEGRRCQRAFIVIPCGETDVREQIVRDLKRDRALREFEGHDGIIESYSISQHEIVLDIFLSCSKVVLLNKLNREVEECLTPYRVQKYTMLCYGYDEPIVTERTARLGSSVKELPSKLPSLGEGLKIS